MALVDIVKYNGNPDVFAWKYPNSELSNWTQLIVNESQEAILVKGGQVCEVYGPGRHTLGTSNVPGLKDLVNLPFGGRSPFSAEVWFVNKVFSLDVKWGTTTPIQIQDPKYKIFIPVRAFGQFGVQIIDSKKFLLKLVGTLPIFDKETIIKYFRGMYLTKIKDLISNYLIHKNISMLEINAYLDEISAYLQGKVSPMFEDYGIKIVSFFVNDINVPENDTAVAQLKKALAKKAEMEIIGYSYEQERSFDTLEGAAKNTGSAQSGFMGAGIGLGMGVGVGGTIGQQFGGLAQNLNTSSAKECPNCKARIGVNERFCNHCGHDTASPKQAIDKVGADMIVCSACKAKLALTMKFCPECGHALIKQCKNCGRQLKDTTKFCPECGTAAE